MANTRAYLAGPDVFLPDPKALAEKKKKICAQYGLEGVFPLDAEVARGELSLREFGLLISRVNEGLIRSCQLVIANVTPFRGPSADVGTAYEMGFARALGLCVFAYTNAVADFATRTRAFVANTGLRDNGQEEDLEHMLIESFDLPDNLMLAGAVVGSGGVLSARAAPSDGLYTALGAFEECVMAAARSIS